MSLKRIAEEIKKYNNFLITTHTNPEGDAVGAELGFYNLLKKLNKRAVILNDDSFPYGYDFLPGKEKILRFNKKSRDINFDCLVVLDCASLARAGEVPKLNKGGKPVLNIDHHISNPGFGDVNWVDAGASSCSEMIFRLHSQFKMKMDLETAYALYTGLATDTGYFRYSCTSSFTHKTASVLLKAGVNPRQVYRAVYESIPLAESEVLIRLLSRIKFSNQGQVAWFKIKKDMLGNKRMRTDLTDQLTTFGRSIKDVEVVAIFRENMGTNNQVRVNLRSQGKVDVNKIAAVFGGGGHMSAAGCTVDGKIDKVAADCLKKINESLK